MTPDAMELCCHTAVKAATTAKQEQSLLFAKQGGRAKPLLQLSLMERVRVSPL